MIVVRRHCLACTNNCCNLSSYGHHRHSFASTNNSCNFSSSYHHRHSFAGTNNSCNFSCSQHRRHSFAITNNCCNYSSSKHHRHSFASTKNCSNDSSSKYRSDRSNDYSDECDKPLAESEAVEPIVTLTPNGGSPTQAETVPVLQGSLNRIRMSFTSNDTSRPIAAEIYAITVFTNKQPARLRQIELTDITAMDGSKAPDSIIVPASSPSSFVIDEPYNTLPIVSVVINFDVLNATRANIYVRGCLRVGSPAPTTAATTPAPSTTAPKPPTTAATTPVPSTIGTASKAPTTPATTPAPSTRGTKVQLRQHRQLLQLLQLPAPKLSRHQQLLQLQAQAPQAQLRQRQRLLQLVQLLAPKAQLRQHQQLLQLLQLPAPQAQLRQHRHLQLVQLPAPQVRKYSSPNKDNLSKS
ncbi:uncharacterized protein [Diadema setosum]|uniref:uncharacterized protein n=1 Tax=Diadema setosum TaxID=31175 RepID=UPI003B3AB4B1